VPLAERAIANKERLARAGHTCAPQGIAWVEIGGDERELREWISPTSLGLRLTAAQAGFAGLRSRQPPESSSSNLDAGCCQGGR
jgi:hypothetical protein